MMRRFRFVCSVVAIGAACTFGLRAADSIESGEAALQYQLGSLLSEETRYPEALEAFDRATRATDPALALRARKGKVKTALRLADYSLARRDGEALHDAAPTDPEAESLYADSLWSAGLFDEADAVYAETLARSPGASRARFGLARSLATRNQLDRALAEAQAASAAAPRDGEIHAAIGGIYERLNRFDEAAGAYTNFINLLPNKDRSEKAAWSRAQVRFLEAFAGKTPLQIDDAGLRAEHRIPFRVVKGKIIVRGRVNGGSLQDFVLDTGAEEVVISRETAERKGVRPITYTLSAGVGDVGLRGLQLARIDTLDIGTLHVGNVPVLIKNPALGGLPKREGESFSPLALGMSVTIDYQQRMLTLARHLPDAPADVILPLRVERLALVRGLLNQSQPAYFVVDTGGEVISISSEVAGRLPAFDGRRIPLKVYGTSGWDRDAFLLPGQQLAFDQIEYRNYPLVVLNLRAPSVLLGFQIGGIVGHTFLGSYRVSLDLERSQLRLQRF